uniref:Uncharacterized protein n=2 Tax=Canis lupus familiaris TaxID=9615 RepID=A0A8I3PEF0_CANLF
ASQASALRAPTDEEQSVTETDAFYRREIFDLAEKYKMDHKRRGTALIFNHKRFWHLTLPDRHGTNKLEDNITEVDVASLYRPA